jgi:hypothetical protein
MGSNTKDLFDLLYLKVQDNIRQVESKALINVAIDLNSMENISP